MKLNVDALQVETFTVSPDLAPFDPEAWIAMDAVAGTKWTAICQVPVASCCVCYPTAESACGPCSMSINIVCFATEAECTLEC